ncbi:hypothetical protein [Pseudomonas sp. G(2018)]|uniref:hypothetical protein n=1 Tax=Pseudomonas sp. G(2018) TaxID=2502242 RepID=UPI0010F5245F|nr:hypothetical protein [Pseudomonas sp. G(2018)]
MLFMHKGSELRIFDGVYSEDTPKGNDDKYYLIKDRECLAVISRFMQVCNALSIDKKDIPSMFRILMNWMRYSDYDSDKKTMYAMMSSDGMAARKREGVVAQFRYYNNYVDLALAIYGEYTSTPTLITETALAGDILRSKGIEKIMVVLSKKINTYAENNITETERDKLLKEKYSTLHAPLDWKTWTDCYWTLDSATLLPYLYDITHNLAGTIKWTETPMDNGRITKETMRVNVGTPREDHNWTARARRSNLPIWAGPSYTTHLMLSVALKAGAREEEIQAFAYVIFAYWNQIYPDTATPVHRMFGVMTAAVEFGVNPLASLPESMYNQALYFLARFRVASL